MNFYLRSGGFYEFYKEKGNGQSLGKCYRGQRVLGVWIIRSRINWFVTVGSADRTINLSGKAIRRAGLSSRFPNMLLFDKMNSSHGGPGKFSVFEMFLKPSILLATGNLNL